MNRQTISQYLLVEAHSNEELTNAINAYIKKGWQPIGGASTYTFHLPKHPTKVFFCYTQALVKWNAAPPTGKKRI